MMGNAIFLRIKTKIIDENNVDARDTLSEMTIENLGDQAKCLVGLHCT